MSDAPPADSSAEDEADGSGSDDRPLEVEVDVKTDRPKSGDDLSDEDKQRIEKEREERLDADNRPDDAEVDNTDRTFDPTTGQFTDSEQDSDLGPFHDPEEEDGED